MLGANPLLDLANRLSMAVSDLTGSSLCFNEPQFLRKAAESAEKLFQGTTNARPSKADAYGAALAFMRAQTLDSRQRHLIAGALSEVILEQGKKRPLGHINFPKLLQSYSNEVASGEMWRLTWFGLLCSYFSFAPNKAPEIESKGWELLRRLLEETWPFIDKLTGQNAVPDWVQTLRQNSELLSHSAANKYAQDYLDGTDSLIRKLATDLGIPEASWFWHTLVFAAVNKSASQSDERFKSSIPKLISLIEQRPVFRDVAIEVILERYFKCSNRPIHPQLRDYVVRKDVWRNPKLRAAGLVTAWTRVPDAVWLMVLKWVNEGNLKDFFDLLAARNKADEGRLAFWTKYIEQISWTRLIFGADTLSLASKNPDVRNLIAREEDSFAVLSANRDLDAFMMQIGKYVIIEFSKKPNACYIYTSNSLGFDRYQKSYNGGTADLKYGFRDSDGTWRITHVPGWEYEAARLLRGRGIYPDSEGRHISIESPHIVKQSVPTDRVITSPSTPSVQKTSFNPNHEKPAPKGAMFTMAGLEKLLSEYRFASVKDERVFMPDGSFLSGRLWVTNHMGHARLDMTLKSWGFIWVTSRSEYYYPEE